MPAFQSDYYVRGFVLKDSNTAAPVDITGWALQAQVRENLDDVTALLDLTTANGGLAITSGVGGRFEIRITAVQTALLPVGRVVFDVRRTDITPGPLWLFGGSFKVKQPVTR